MGFFNTHPFLVTLLSALSRAMERSKQDVNSIQSTVPSVHHSGDWRCDLPTAGVADRRKPRATRLILGAVVFVYCLTWYLGLRFGLAHYAYRMGDDSSLKANTKKVGHAASIVGMTVIAPSVATYVRLSTTLEITAGDAVVGLQADVIDKLMPAFLRRWSHLTMFWLVRRGWSPLRPDCSTVVLSIVDKFCHFL